MDQSDAVVTNVRRALQVPRWGVVFPGSCGANVGRWFVQQYDPNRHTHMYGLAIDTDGPKLNLNFPVDGEDEYAKRLRSWTDAPGQRFRVLPIGEGGGAGGDPEIGKKLFRDHAQEDVEEWMRDKDEILAVTGFGGGSGPMVIPIAKMAKRMGKTMLAIVAMPRQRKGYETVCRALRSRDELLEDCSVALVLNENVQNKRLTQGQAYAQINEACIFSEFELVYEVTQVVGDQENADRNDLEKALRYGKHVFLNRCEIPRPAEGVEVDPDRDDFDASQVADALITNPYYYRGVLENSRRFIIVFHGAMSMESHDIIVDGIERRTRCKLKDTRDVVVKEQITERVTDGRRWVGLMAVSNQPPDDVSFGPKPMVTVPDVQWPPRALEAPGGDGVAAAELEPAPGFQEEAPAAALLEPARTGDGAVLAPEPEPQLVAEVEAGRSHQDVPRTLFAVPAATPAPASTASGAPSKPVVERPGPLSNRVRIEVFLGGNSAFRSVPADDGNAWNSFKGAKNLDRQVVTEVWQRIKNYLSEEIDFPTGLHFQPSERRTFLSRVPGLRSRGA